MFSRTPTEASGAEDRADVATIGSRRLRAVRVLVLLGTMAGVLLSLPLWGWGERTFPHAPPLPFLPAAVPQSVEVALLGLLFLSLVGGIVFVRRRWPLLLILAIAFLFCLLDQMRWQPWFYQYMAMLALLAALPMRKSRTVDSGGNNKEDKPGDTFENAVLSSCAAVMAFTYLWSGLHKFNESFFLTIFPVVFGPFLNLFPLEARETVTGIGGFAAALGETGIGIALFFPKVRNVAVVALVVQHLVLLYCLGPAGMNYNTVVWPWNLAMILLAITIFWNSDGLDARHMLLPNTRTRAAALCLFGVLPILSFFGRWDSYLSAALYSGDIVWGKLEIADSARARLPRSMDRHLTTVGYNGTMDLNTWAVDELGVTVYPEPRVLRQVLADVCQRYARSDDDIVLTIHERPPPNTRLRAQTRLTCADVSPPPRRATTPKP